MAGFLAAGPYLAKSLKEPKHHFFRSWCLTTMKGKTNPLPKNSTIIPSSLHLFSTEKGRFCRTETLLDQRFSNCGRDTYTRTYFIY